MHHHQQVPLLVLSHACAHVCRLDAVPLQHQKMRRKALRMLLRHTDAAIDELRDDDDEMLRGDLDLRLNWLEFQLLWWV